MIRSAAGLDLVEEPGDEYSLIVAAPPYEFESRYRPFNFKASEERAAIERNQSMLTDACDRLSHNGLMFVYGLPAHLARYATALSSLLTLRYWISVRTMTSQKRGGLRPEHTGLLLLSKPAAPINTLRVAHPRCRCCDKTLKDWGGKSHLMHPAGVRLSDVWRDLVVDPKERMPAEVFERILQLSQSGGRNSLLLIAPDIAHTRAPEANDDLHNLLAFNPLELNGAKNAGAIKRRVPEQLLDRCHNAPCLDVLKAIPSETVDLAFADPPFNLTKEYNGYSDDRGEGEYVGWSKRWLVEYERVLKPGGALVLLNLPKWAALLADFLSRAGKLYLQNWIVWDSLPEPKGVLMPAHYSLLYFTKGPRAARFNYCSMEDGWQPFDEAVFPPDRADVCQRRACVRRRRASAHLWRGELTDVWFDIHRDRRQRRDGEARRAHPCQTPDRLLDRIIRLTTNPGDLVLDGFAGTGTSALVAKRLGRHFIAIEQDGGYLAVAARRMSANRSSARPSKNRLAHTTISKRRLQLELQRLARLLGRLPDKADVEFFSHLDPHAFEERFASWGDALKAARLVVSDWQQAESEDRDPANQLELFEPAMTNGEDSELHFG
ncbi:MAG TPA: DNA methyltransferase [Blastocatellia bacterium]|nr:DNA methyltransferase [Blastocatellia bacterium]